MEFDFGGIGVFLIFLFVVVMSAIFLWAFFKWIILALVLIGGGFIIYRNPNARSYLSNLFGGNTQPRR